MIRKVYDKELIRDMILQDKRNAANIDGSFNENFVEKEYRRITRSLSEKSLGENYCLVLEAVKEYIELIGFALNYSFARGMYAGFEQYFTGTGPKNPFETYVLREIYFSNAESKNNEYYNNMRKVRELTLRLEENLVGNQKENVLNLLAVWRDRLDKMFRDSFFKGCVNALGTVENVNTEIGSYMVIWLAGIIEDMGIEKDITTILSEI